MFTHDQKTMKVMSTNLRGPSACWLKRMDGRERLDCILRGAKELSKIIEAAIERRSNNSGAAVPFSLATDATSRFWKHHRVIKPLWVANIPTK